MGKFFLEKNPYHIRSSLGIQRTRFKMSVSIHFEQESVSCLHLEQLAEEWLGKLN